MTEVGGWRPSLRRGPRTGTALLLLLLAATLVGCSSQALPPPLSAGSTVSGVAASGDADTTLVRVAALKGPTGMGLAALIHDHPGTVEATIRGTPDEVTGRLVKGDLDVALVPANLAAVLAAKTDGGVQAVAVTTLGVLYVVERGEAVHALADLAGKTVLTTGKGTTPQYVADHILAGAGLTDRVSLDYRSESTEVTAALASGQADLGILPEPYVSTLMAKDPSIRVALDLTAEWDAVTPDSSLVTGVMVVRSQFAIDHPLALRGFLDDYAASVSFTNDHPDQAAPLIAGLGIVPSREVAVTAIPRCHIVNITGSEMKIALSGYLQVLFDADPAAVGGALPGDTFYYGV
ncbi:MAG: PhnD/SsuA/transferrin family substrate-binding protein [Propionibacteriaceae bacterium]|nr:PhnD/SsuA/transferrin family substrate-binding protein [Propionibacteriaceae bacterium]